MIERKLNSLIKSRISDKKVIIILGARQVGKSTLLHELFGATKKVMWWNGDEPDIRTMLQNATSTRLIRELAHAKVLVIDEAQRIENIGLSLKLIYDNLPSLKIIATGSSAFELANKINEPLTGRKWEYQMFPLSVAELVQKHGQLTEKRLLPQRLIYGQYPDVVTHPGDEKELLLELTNNYLYRDILAWQRIQKPQKLEKLVQALAFQIGSQVSYNELGKTLGLDNQTIEQYVNLLEKSFVVFTLPSFSRNLRNELKKSRKIYFYDNGVRNAIINQFAPVELRNDTGALWENYMVSELLKKESYARSFAKHFFWRTKAQQEIDLISEANGLLSAYEFKWNLKSKAFISKTFIKAYPNAATHIVHRDNYLEYLVG